MCRHRCIIAIVNYNGHQATKNKPRTNKQRECPLKLRIPMYTKVWYSESCLKEDIGVGLEQLIL